MLKLIRLVAGMGLLPWAFLTVLVAQTIPEKIDFQAMARDAAGEPLTMRDVTVQMTILAAPLPGTPVYTETHEVTTDPYGLFVLAIGTGTAATGSFADIDWKAGPYFVRIAIDEDGGTDYLELGTMELMTVPYAFYSQYTEHVDDADADPSNELQQLSLQGEVLSLSGGNQVQLPDASAENELQTLAIGQNNVLSISRGNSIQLPSLGSVWSQNGSSVYLESGRVGIGLSNVPHTLSLYGQNQAYMSFLTSATDVDLERGLIIGLNRLSNSALIWNYERGDIRLGTDGKTRMYISPLGRIGIGTESPEYNLEVAAEDNHEAGMRIRSAENYTARISLMERTALESLGFSWEYQGAMNALTLRSNGFRNDADAPLITVQPDGVSGLVTQGVLDLSAIENESTILQFTNARHTGARLVIGLNRGTPVIDASRSMLIKADNRTAIAVADLGRVGIGKDRPDTELDVAGNVQVSGSIQVSTDLTIAEDANLRGTLKVGDGATFNQIQEFTGTTTKTGDKLDWNYPAGYNRSNTRILCLEIQFSTGNWANIGTGSLERVHAVLFEDYIRIFYPSLNDYQNRPFRILLMRMGR